jgi:transposase
VPVTAVVADRTESRASFEEREPGYVRKVVRYRWFRQLEGHVDYLGIDVGKADFHCALLVGSATHPKSFPNSKKGFEQLRNWLRNRRVDRVQACMEATGGWSDELGLFLYELGHQVSIVNPRAIKAFGQSEGSRTKTDKADAALIARFCKLMQPRLWEPPSPSQRRLQRLGRRRSALIEMRTQEHNRLEGPGIDEVRHSLESSLAFLDRQIKAIDAEIAEVIDSDPDLRNKRELLGSIPGIGPGVSSTLLGELPTMTEFRNGKALAAFVGLCPRVFRSGTSVNASWLSKAGNPRVRAILYMPALSAMRHNPVLVAFADRLRARGKHGRAIIAAVMRRLLVIAHGVLKSGKPFEARLAA